MRVGFVLGCLDSYWVPPARSEHHKMVPAASLHLSLPFHPFPLAPLRHAPIRAPKMVPTSSQPTTPPCTHPPFPRPDQCIKKLLPRPITISLPPFPHHSAMPRSEQRKMVPASSQPTSPPCIHQYLGSYQPVRMQTNCFVCILSYIAPAGANAKQNMILSADP